MKTKKVSGEGWVIYCPACDEHHVLSNKWLFSGTIEQPTFTPSLKVSGCLRQPDNDGKNGVYGVCHSVITDGKIIYQNDCTHALAGKTVELSDLDRGL